MSWWNKLGDSIKDGWKATTSFVENRVIPAVQHGATEAWDKVQEYAPKIWHKTQEVAPVVMAEVTKDAGIAFHKINETYHESVNAVKDSITNTEHFVENVVGKAGGALTQPLVLIAGGAAAIIAISLMRK